MPRRDPSVPLIYATVVVSGASVMVLEILAPRLLGPVYGSGAQVWAAVISVTLAALAAGYWLGGQVADRWPRATVFHAFVVLAAIAVIAVHGMAGAVAEACATLGLRGGVIVSTVLIFGPALVLLATLTPLACRVHPGHAERTGRTVGRLYAVSTLGSVAGALLAGFVLLPAWPISRSLLGTGLLLAVVGVTGLVIDWRKSAVAVAAVALAVGLAPSPAAPASGVTVVRDEQTVYHRIQTLDTEEERLLLMDGALHTHISTIRTLDPVLCEYARAVELIPILRPEARRFLLIGCGGGAMLRVLEDEGRTFDVVDVDEAVLNAAREDFGAGVEGARFIVADGRRFLRQGDRWDVILLDVVSTDAMPEHLCTVEFFRELRKHLTEDGVLFMNSIGRLQGRVLDALGATLADVFPERLAVNAHVEASSTNVLWFCSSQPLVLNDWARAAYRHRFLDPPGGGLVLTDDYNPINAWNADLGLEMRADLQKTLGRAVLRAR